MRPGYGWKGRVAPAAMVKVQGLSPWPRSRSGSRRTTTRSSASSDDADQKEITKAYRKLARENHPTPSPATPRPRSGSRRSRPPTTCRRPRQAQGVRRGPPARSDGRLRRRRRRARAASAAGWLHVHHRGLRRWRRPRRHPRQPVRPRAAAGAGRPAAPGPQRGADLEAELHLSFIDAVDGITTTRPPHQRRHLLDLPRQRRPARARRPIVCPPCAGPGRRRRQPGPVLVQLAVPALRAAAGSIVEDPCPTCQGSGVERRPREVKVRIPAGVTDGQRIRLKGRGGPGRNGGPPGDLYVICRVAPHELFGVDGSNLTLTVPVTFAEAALGADIAVPTLDGGTVDAPDPGRHPHRPHVPGEGPGRAGAEGHRRPAGHRRGGGARPSSRRPSARRSRRWPPPADESPARPPGGGADMAVMRRERPRRPPST